jgi:hypothetical protein
MEEVEDRFVTAYTDSVTRAALFHRMRMLVTTAHEHLPCVLVIASGEFVTDTTDPHDIFIVLNVPAEDIEGLEGKTQWLLDELFKDGEREFGDTDGLTVYTGIARAYPPGHHKFELGQAENRLQRFLASSPADGAESTGYLEILVCEGGLKEIHEILRPPAP